MVFKVRKFLRLVSVYYKVSIPSLSKNVRFEREVDCHRVEEKAVPLSAPDRWRTWQPRKVGACSFLRLVSV